MPSLFSRMRGKDGQAKLKSKKNANFDGHEDQSAAKPRWEDAYTRNTVEPEEIEELVRLCTKELKARGMTPVSRGTVSRRTLQQPVRIAIR